MSWLDQFFTQQNYKTAYVNGTALPPQPAFELEGDGVTAENDTVNGITRYVIEAGGGGALPTGTGWGHLTDGEWDPAARAINIASADISGTLPPANGGTGITALGTGVATFLATATATTWAALAALAQTLTNKSIDAATNTITGITNSSIASGAAIALSKIVNPTGSGLVKTVSGVIQSASALLVNADVDAAAGISGSKVAPDFAAQLVQTTGNMKCTGYIYTSSSTIPSTGNIRLANGNSIVGINGAGSADACICTVSTGDNFYVGHSAGFANIVYTWIANSTVAYYFAIASSYKLVVEAAAISLGVPIVGYSTPFTVHGYVVSSQTDANYTVPAAEYVYKTILFSTACTTGRTMTLPAPAAGAANAYYPKLNNTTGQTLTISIGSGTTQTLATNTGAEFRVTSSGVFKSGATYVP